VSLTTQERQGDGSSYSPSISGDGRYVAFETEASNLQDEDWFPGVVVRDRLAGVLLQPLDDNQDAMFGESPAVSADGRYVAYMGFLGPECCPSPQMFVWNRVTRKSQPLSAEISGESSNATFGPPAISADGRYVAFASDSNVVKGDSNGAWDIFVRDRVTRATRRVSIASNGQQADSDSLGAAITADGSSVAFDSGATNLVRGDTNNAWDVFVRDPLLDAAEAGNRTPLADRSSAPVRSAIQNGPGSTALQKLVRPFGYG
jgi:Tol biopolymer transport system component